MVIGKKSSNRFIQLNNWLTNEKKRKSEHDQFYLQDILERIKSGKLTSYTYCSNNNLTEINNEEIIKTAIAKEYSYDEFKFASKHLKTNRQFISECLAINGGILKYLSKEFKNDEELVLIAVKCYGWSLVFASDSLKSNKKIVEAAIQSRCGSLIFASNELKVDRSLVGLAVRYNPAAMVFSKFDIDQPYQANCISDIILANGVYLHPSVVRSMLFPSRDLKCNTNLLWFLEILIRCRESKVFGLQKLNQLLQYPPQDNYIIQRTLLSAFIYGKTNDTSLFVNLGLRYFNFLPHDLEIFPAFLKFVKLHHGEEWFLDFIRKRIEGGWHFAQVVGAAYYCMNEEKYSSFKSSFEFLENNFSQLAECYLLLFPLTFFGSAELCKTDKSFSLLSYPDMVKDSKAVKIMEKMPENNGIVQFFLGCKWYFLESYQTHRAFNHFYQAALFGIAAAQYNVAIMYEHGEGVSPNDLHSMNWLLKAVGLLCPEAFYYMGEISIDYMVKKIQINISFNQLLNFWLVAVVLKPSLCGNVIEKFMQVEFDYENILASINKFAPFSIKYKILNAIFDYFQNKNVQNSENILKEYGLEFGEEFLQKIPSNKCSYCNGEMIGFNFECDCHYLCKDCKNGVYCGDCGETFRPHHYFWYFIGLFKYVYEKCQNDKLKHLMDTLSLHIETVDTEQSNDNSENLSSDVSNNTQNDCPTNCEKPHDHLDDILK